MTSTTTTPKVFVDAAAGSIGSVLAMTAFFPLDVIKIRLQAHVSKFEENLDQGVLTICKSIKEKEGYAGLFRGFQCKALHTFISSFAFFYWFSFLKIKYQRRFGNSVSTSGNLLLNSIAGVINMSMTLPLELISTKLQVSLSPSAIISSHLIGPKKKVKETTWSLVKAIYLKHGILAFWKGYTASIVLISNPAINYTIVDYIKKLLEIRRGKIPLTILESFVLGVFAKMVATLVTYPLIRAKVIMQTQNKRVSPIESDGSTDVPCNSPMGTTITNVLYHIYKMDGLKGFYNGCSTQLLNTVLKSGLLLVTREKITVYTMRLLSVLRNHQILLKN